MIALLLWFYPSAWRRRYGDEFAAVLEERPLGPFDVADVLLGALDAHLHGHGRSARSDVGKGFSMTLRIGGLAAIAFGLLWALGLAWASAGDTDNDTIATSMIVIANVSLILALVGLSAFQARRHPRLVWASIIVPAVGSAVSLVGAIGLAVDQRGELWFGDNIWDIWAGGTLAMGIGSILFAIATYQTGALDRRAALLMGVGAAISLVAALFNAIVLLVGLVVFSLGWIWLGLDALRRDRAVLAPTG